MPNLPWTYKTICQLTIMGVAHGSQIVNVHHFEASQVLEATLVNDATAVTAAGALADTWISTYKTPFMACHPADYVMVQVTAQILERPSVFRHRLTPVERPTGGAGSAGAGGTAEELAASAVIKWRTPVAGKSFRGRTYMGPIGAGWVSDGRLIAAGITAYTAYITPMLAEYGAAGSPPEPWALTVYSRPYNAGEYQYATRKTGTLTVETPPDYAGRSTNVTSGSVDPIVRTQRRRQIGVGA